MSELPKETEATKEEKVTAGPRDTFCSIAVGKGFPNCSDLRKLKKNKEYFESEEKKKKDKLWVLEQNDPVYIPEKKEGKESRPTEKESEFGRPGEPPVSVRFVHGEPDDATCPNHKQAAVLNISNYQTDKAGKDRTEDFPKETVQVYEQHAHQDYDAFKVEVHDAQTKKDELEVSIEALRPVYEDDKKATWTGEPKSWNQYDKKEKSDGRELPKLVAKRMPDGAKAPTEEEKRTGKNVNTHFRTCYLRLVVDEHDWKARKKQTLRIEPMVDTDEKMEILDHKVRAVYEVTDCAAVPKCRAIDEVPVGEGKKRVELAIHILRKTRTGAGVVSEDDTRKWFLRYLRQFYAQANLSLQFVRKKLKKEDKEEKEVIRLVPPPANMLAVSNREGKPAVKDKKIKIDVTVDSDKKTVEITTKENQTPYEVAKELAKEIENAFGADKVKAVASENPIVKGKTKKSADVLVGNPLDQKIELKVVTCEDPDYVKAWDIDTTRDIVDFLGDEAHVGTPEERILMKNYHIKGSHVDIFIVHSIKGGVFGEAFRIRKITPDLKGLEPIVNSVLFQENVFTGRLRTVPHELGHVLMDFGSHVKGDLPELMTGGSAVGAKFNQELEATKRLADPDKTAAHKEIKYSDRTKQNSTKMIREKNTPVLGSW